MSLDKKQAVVSLYQEVDTATIRATIEKLGFEVVSIEE